MRDNENNAKRQLLKVTQVDMLVQHVVWDQEDNTFG